MTEQLEEWAESEVQTCDICGARMLYSPRTDLHNCPICRNARQGSLIRWLREHPKRA